MKLAQTFSKIATAFVLALGMVASTTQSQAAAAPGMQSIQAKVKSVEGDANYSSGGATKNLTVGMEVPAESVVNTGPSGRVVLDLGPSGTVTIKPESSLSIDKLQVQKVGGDSVVETKLEVKKGSILGNVKKISAASKYEVANSKGVAGIRGTTYQIFAIGIFQCADGQLVVRLFNLVNGQQQTFTVGPSRGVDASNNETPTPQQLAADLVAEIRKEAGFAGQLGPDGPVIAVGDADAIQEAINRVIERSNQSTTNPKKPEEEMSPTES